jgi:hypothetical protein
MRNLITLFAAAALCAATHAAPPTEDSIKTLLTEAKVEQLIGNMLAGVTESVRQGMYASLQGQTLSDEQKRTLDAVPAKFGQAMRKEMSWATLRPMYVQIYRDTFTQKEIDGLIAFYKSPTGVAFVDKMPAVMQKSQALMQTRIGPMAEGVRAAMQEAVAAVKAAK